MKTLKSILQVIVVSTIVGLFASNNTFANEYVSLNGLDTIKAVFDVRAGKVKSAAIQLDLIHQTFKDKNIQNVTSKPDFAVVFGGGAVKLVSSNTESYSAEEKVLIGQIATTLKAMAKDGIKLEICLFAANLFKVDPATILPELKQVNNGWISLIGYQSKGYALVAVF